MRDILNKLYLLEATIPQWTSKGVMPKTELPHGTVLQVKTPKTNDFENDEFHQYIAHADGNWYQLDKFDKAIGSIVKGAKVLTEDDIVNANNAGNVSLTHMGTVGKEILSPLDLEAAPVGAKVSIKNDHSGNDSHIRTKNSEGMWHSDDPNRGDFHSSRLNHAIKNGMLSIYG